ncbi:alpha and gamma adaptin binding protein p34 [Cordyceps javanica]|uniref:Alpha and gamma adaptin binding protein p34 n=1 Tax=Cordyceps javanica TaxID=43265 RepID=A0A545UZF7_9HYPO|nr:alpha and gamma adaptin binding protein p34 [Cordyceps javanica]TQW06713.1 alpha and gamma adaptin binding protein p34 [Cordyceps javanica]
MDIKNPKRALAVSLQSDKEHLSRIISGITGSEPIPAEGSLAGITHELRLETKYYTTTVPVWLDLIDSPSEWASSFLSDEAAEVLGVLGGLILVFAIPDSSGGSVASAPVADGADDDDNNPTRQLIRHVGAVVHQGLGGWAWDGVKLAVGVGGGGALDVDEWDELCAEAGLEFVQVGGDGDENKLQQFGEKSGIPRIKEALEANEWDLGSADELPSGEEEAASASAEGEKKKKDEGDGKQRSSDDDKALLGPDDMDFGLDRAADLETLKKALFANSQEQQQQQQQGYYNDGEEEEEQDIDEQDVAKVEAMMRKLQAAREAGETMGEAQRRKMAAKAVEEVMRQL